MDPYIPGQMRLLIASPTVFQDRKLLERVMESPWMQSIFPFLFFSFSLPLTVSLNPVLFLPPSKCYPLTCRGEIQLSQAQIEQGREEGQALKQRQKGKEPEKRRAEGE